MKKRKLIIVRRKNKKRKEKKLQLQIIRREVYWLCWSMTLKYIYSKGLSGIRRNMNEYDMISKKIYDKNLVHDLFVPNFVRHPDKLSFQKYTKKLLQQNLKPVTKSELKQIVEESGFIIGTKLKNEIIDFLISKTLGLRDPFLSFKYRKIEMKQLNNGKVSVSGINMFNMFIPKDVVAVIFSFFKYLIGSTSTKLILDNIGLVNSKFYIILLECFGFNCVDMVLDKNNIYSIPVNVLMTLRIVELNTTEFYKDHLAYLKKNLLNIKKLTIRGDKTNKYLKMIKQSQYLRTIRLGYGVIEKIDLSILNKFPKLNKLILGGRHYIINQDVILENIEKLKFDIFHREIVIFRPTTKIDIRIKDINTKVFANVKEISFKSFMNIDWKGIKKFKRLERLKFSVNNGNLERLNVNLPNVKELDVDITTNTMYIYVIYPRKKIDISSGVLNEISDRFPNLEHIILRIETHFKVPEKDLTERFKYLKSFKIYKKRELFTCSRKKKY